MQLTPATESAKFLFIISVPMKNYHCTQYGYVNHEISGGISMLPLCLYLGIITTTSVLVTQIRQAFSSTLKMHIYQSLLLRRTSKYSRNAQTIVKGRRVSVNDDLRKVNHNMMTSSNGNIFRVTGHLCGKFTGPRWISRTKASDTELWCFLWLTPD